MAATLWDGNEIPELFRLIGWCLPKLQSRQDNPGPTLCIVIVHSLARTLSLNTFETKPIILTAKMTIALVLYKLDKTCLDRRLKCWVDTKVNWWTDYTNFLSSKDIINQSNNPQIEFSLNLECQRALKVQETCLRLSSRSCIAPLCESCLESPINLPLYYI